MSPTPRVLMLVIWFCAGAGCAPWQESSLAPAKLPPTRMSADSVALEISFVGLPPGSEEIGAIWDCVDEQQLPIELRRRLSANGFRCGLVGAHLPPLVRNLLDSRSSGLEIQSEDGATLDSEVTWQQRKLQSRTGRRGTIVATNNREEMIVLLNEDGQVRGQTYQQGQCQFALKTYPRGDGRVRLELTPEIEYGQPRQRWVGQEGAFRLETGRQRTIFHDLQMELVLSPGQTLLLTCTPEAKGLGKQFFAAGPTSGIERNLVLIRLAQTQLDDLFALEPATAPIATPAE